MGGPALNKDAIKKFILSQDKPFTPIDISIGYDKGNCSGGSAYRLINEMISQGKVAIDHKVGGEIHYAVTSAAGKATIKANVKEGKGIMSMPPAERFRYVAHLTDMVIEGISPSLLITGVAGIGKTFIVKKQLAAAKTEGEYVFIQGHSSPQGLYKCLFDYKDRIVVFDDCDSVFDDEGSVNILKAALDSYATRNISWQSMRMPEDLPKSFDFKGQVIFVSNRMAHTLDEAIKSRTLLINLQMSRPEICDYIGNIMHDIEPIEGYKLPMNLKIEVLEHLRDKADLFDQFNIRTFIKACRIRRKAESVPNVDWKKMCLVVI